MHFKFINKKYLRTTRVKLNKQKDNNEQWLKISVAVGNVAGLGRVAKNFAFFAVRPLYSANPAGSRVGGCFFLLLLHRLSRTVLSVVQVKPRPKDHHILGSITSLISQSVFTLLCGLWTCHAKVAY